MIIKIILSATTLSIAVAIFSITIAFFDPFQLFVPPSIPGSKDILHNATVIQIPGAVGPESLAFDPNGEGPYVGVADGRILKWLGHENGGWVDFAYISSQREKCVRSSVLELEHICGRPLGLRFDEKTGDLYVADAYFGIQVTGPSGGFASPVVTEAEGQPLYFTNDMDIDDHEDVIYFSESSQIFRRRHFIASLYTGDKTGRLFKYDKASKKLSILLQGIAIANGVALSRDRSFVLVSEIATGKILRYWLKGENAGKSDIFAELPGYPDNIRRNTEGEFWVGLHAKRGLFGNWILSYPWASKIFYELPLNFKQFHLLIVGGKAHATAVKAKL